MRKAILLPFVLLALLASCQRRIVEMTHAMSADGAKYQAADGRFIWNKGKRWTYGKGEEKLCGCSEK